MAHALLTWAPQGLLASPLADRRERSRSLPPAQSQTPALRGAKPFHAETSPDPHNRAPHSLTLPRLPECGKSHSVGRHSEVKRRAAPAERPLPASLANLRRSLLLWVRLLLFRLDVRLHLVEVVLLLPLVDHLLLTLGNLLHQL